VLNRWLGPIAPHGTTAGYAYCSVGVKKADYPRGQVKNAFIRRGYKVFANRGLVVSHYSGAGHSGYVPANPEAFDDRVEEQ
jgi:hypothetical protein